MIKKSKNHGIYLLHLFSIFQALTTLRTGIQGPYWTHTFPWLPGIMIQNSFSGQTYLESVLVIKKIITMAESKLALGGLFWGFVISGALFWGFVLILIRWSNYYDKLPSYFHMGGWGLLLELPHGIHCKYFFEGREINKGTLFIANYYNYIFWCKSFHTILKKIPFTALSKYRL